ncbi:MarR family transcriptional regulator [Kribbella italica]|uniref:DNA-binding MarR family transcriptional regulator n=1 Tax=Kribbella italica TaxID=1540520 RepID=A0A7W9J4R7_9ACTN|nr:DNA-binding MarR family transcriptional regulator [Kribbella italica]
MTDLPEALADRTAFLLRLALNRAEAMGEQAIEPLGLTGRQYGVLAMLQNGPATTQRQLGLTLGFDRTTTMKLMAGLQARGLVDRVADPTDRRSYRLSLTEDGERLRARTAKILTTCDEEFTQRLSPTELEQLRTLLRRLI